MQTKQHAMQKPHSCPNRNKIYKGLFFVVEGFRAKSPIFVNSISLNCIQYIFIYTFSYALWDI